MEKRSIVVQVKQEMAVTTELEQLLPVVEEKLPLSSASKPKKPSTEATSAAPSPKAKEKQEQKKVKVELAETVLDEKVGLSNENNNNKQQQKWQLQRIVSAAENQCRCLIDLSSPASLERDFYAWLNGSEPVNDISRPCLFSNIQSYSPPSPPITLLNMPTSQRLSMLSLQHHTTTECHYSHGFVPGGCKVPAFLVAPPPPPLPASVSDCASSACSLSSSSISPGTNCSSTFGSSRDNNNNNNIGGSSSASSAAASSSFSCSYQLQPSSFPPHFHQNLQQQQQQKIKSVSADQFFGGIAGGNAAEKTTMICGGAARMRRKRNVDKASGRGTNLYGRSYCPGRPLSMEERAQIVQLFHGGMKVNAISKQLCISHGCVSKIITRFRETGNLMPSSHSECRRRKRQQQQQLQQQQLNLGQGIG